MSLPQLPSHIELRSPSPDPSPLSQINADSESSLESEPQRLEKAPTYTRQQSLHTVSDGRSNELASEDAKSNTEVAVNAFLSALPVSEIVPAFPNSDTGRPSILSGSAHADTAWRGDTLQTVFTSSKKAQRSGYHNNYLKTILVLISKNKVSTSHFLEAVTRKVNGREAEIMQWLARDIEISKHGARALGTAAYRDNFEAVDVLLELGVDIKDSVSYPHSTSRCRCQISVIAYAQLPRFNDDGPGASDEMIAYLLSRGATKSIGVDMHLLGLLDCVLRQQATNHETLPSKVQSIVQRVHGFANFAYESESVLETCILESKDDDSVMDRRFQAFEYLLDEGAETRSGSPLAALIYMNGPRKLVKKLLSKTKNINAYCNSLSRDGYSLRVDKIPRPHDMIQSVSPLQAAALRGDEEIIDLLLQNGADVNCPAWGPGGVTPLQAICYLKANTPQDRARKMRIASLLVNKGAKVNAAPARYLGLSALQAASFVGDVQIAGALVSHGADVNAPACKRVGGTALALAARQRHVHMVRFLLKAGALVPPAGVKILCLSVAFDHHRLILELLGISVAELTGMGGVDSTPSRDYHEYEADWANDATYENESQSG